MNQTVELEPPAAKADPERSNMDHWRGALEKAGLEGGGVVQSFGEPRYLVLERMVRAGVAHPRWEAAPLAVFLQAPESFIDPVQSARIHLFIEPAPGSFHPRIKFKNITGREALGLVEQLQTLPGRNGYVATVVESPQLLFHGNVHVEGGEIRAEFVRGASVPVSRGAQPEFRMWQDQYLETFRYNFESPELRSLLFEALKLIPSLHDGVSDDSFRPHLLPGYYEVGITDQPDGKPGRMYLYDMKPGEA